MQKLYLMVLISVLLFSCEKTLDIGGFSDEFGNYQSELKIEGLLKPDKPEESIIRIIKSVVITDNQLYNNIDDDGDGYVECTIDSGGWDGDLSVCRLPATI